MKAYQLKRIDQEYDMHLQAWLNHVVTASKEQGKKQVPVFKKFEDFFDYEKRLKEVIGEQKRQIRLTPKQKKMAEFAAKINERG